MSRLITVDAIQDAINNLGLPQKITRTQLEYWRAGTRAVVRALNDAIQAAPPIDGVAYIVLNPFEARASTDLGGIVQACPEGGDQTNQKPTPAPMDAGCGVVPKAIQNAIENLAGGEHPGLVQQLLGMLRPYFTENADSRYAVESATCDSMLQNQQQNIPVAKSPDRDLAHNWIRPVLGLDENAPYRFDFYAQEIDKLIARAEVDRSPETQSPAVDESGNLQSLAQQAAPPCEQKGDLVGWLRRRSTPTGCVITGELAGEIADHIESLQAQQATDKLDAGRWRKVSGYIYEIKRHYEKSRENRTRRLQIDIRKSSTSTTKWLQDAVDDFIANVDATTREAE